MDSFKEYNDLVKTVSYLDGDRAANALYNARQSFFEKAVIYAESLQVLNKKFDTDDRKV